MKTTIKNSVIGALALFGLFAIISGATSKENNSKNVFIDNANFEMHKMEDGKIMVFNKENGEVEYKKINGEFAVESISIDSWPSLYTYENM